MESIVILTLLNTCFVLLMMMVATLFTACVVGMFWVWYITIRGLVRYIQQLFWRK